MATAEQTPVATEEAPKARGRKARPSFIEENYPDDDKTKLGGVPDFGVDSGQFNPDYHAQLKEANFADDVDYYRYKVKFHQFFASKNETKVEKLEKLGDKDTRQNYARAINTKDNLVAYFRKLAANGVDTTELMAELSAEVDEAVSS